MDKIEPGSYVIKKTTVEVYKLRHPTGLYWADITIDAQGKAGRISIASDFGDWQNYWGSCGSSFKEFLCGIDRHYAGNKFGSNKWFNHEKTIAGLKHQISESEKYGYQHSKEVKEGALAEIAELTDYIHKEEFINQIRDMQGREESYLDKFYDGWPDIVESLDPGFVHFWEGPWQAFIEALRIEEPIPHIYQNK